ncbi:NfeD family protein [Arthrobacter sp. JSM 101049]|uniref:NfeD family protein n=1 Tax=Arthrobacter sp. JSM 101049 TaxID=929097 RepID=UPI0035686D7E
MFEWVIANAWVFWLALFLVLAIVEMMSLDLYFIMLSAGALGGVFVALAGGGFWLQVLVFCLLSLAMVFFVRPIALRQLHKGPADRLTNVDRLVGQDALVLEPTTKMGGRAKIGGETWSVRSEDETPLAPGMYGTVVRIDGATAFITTRAAGAHGH